MANNNTPPTTYTVYSMETWGIEPDPYRIGEFRSYDEAVEYAKYRTEEYLANENPAYPATTASLDYDYFRGESVWVSPVPAGQRKFTSREYVEQLKATKKLAKIRRRFRVQRFPNNLLHPNYGPTLFEQTRYFISDHILMVLFVIGAIVSGVALLLYTSDAPLSGWEKVMGITIGVPSLAWAGLLTLLLLWFFIRAFFELMLFIGRGLWFAWDLVTARRVLLRWLPLKALVFAAVWHRGQQRKTDTTPFIYHPMAVAWIVAQYASDPAVAAAALLHDTCEDTIYATPDAIRQKFGERVLQLVQDVTEPKLPEQDRQTSWRQRKESYLAHLQGAEEGALLICAADKIHNLRSLMDAYHTYGDDIWPKFNATREEKLWFYREVTAVIRQRLDNVLAKALENTYNDAIALFGPLSDTLGTNGPETKQDKTER